jgi:hypothetical protein
LERILIKLQGIDPGISGKEYGNDFLIYDSRCLYMGNEFTPAVIIPY